MFQRGQAFDVFKLLIAAVVAIALLTVLLPIIGNIGGIGQNKPIDTAVREIKDLVTNPSLHRLTDPVVFKEGDSLNAKSIAAKTNVLSDDQVCVSAGEFASDPNFVVTQLTGTTSTAASPIVEYKSKTAKTVRLSVLCDAGTALDDDLKNYNLTDKIDTSACSCKASSQTCCIVAIRKT